MSKIGLGANISSLAAQRGLNSATSALTKSFERLSSGQRINRASDDAAGLSIASALNATGRVFTQAIRNVNDGISALSIAEGAIQQLTSILQRQNDLATQAANGIYNSKQRTALQTESNALTSEYNRIIATTSFNGSMLLSGGASQLQIQVGTSADANSRIMVDFSTLLSSTAVAAAEVDTFDFGNTGVAEVSSVRIMKNGDLVSDGTILPGDYVQFSGVDSSGNTQQYYGWFYIDGAGVDPTPGGSGFRIDLTATDDAIAVGTKFVAAYNTAFPVGAVTISSNYAILTITSKNPGNTTAPTISSGLIDGYVNTTTQGSSITAGNYFTFSTPTSGYYVWFRNTTSSTGSDPGLSGRTGIQVNYTATETSTTIRNSAVTAISTALGLQASVSATATTYATGLTITNLVSGSVSAPSGSGMSVTMNSTQNTVGSTGGSATVSNLDLSTESAARNSLTTIDTQMQTVASTLGTYGAAQSRLESVVKTLAVARENNIAAASRIMDVDIANESANLIRSQLLQQASTAVLAQANQQQRLALKLLNI